MVRLTFINVGYGEAILIEYPHPVRPDKEMTLLIDGGSADPQEYANSVSGRIALERYLRQQGISHLDLAVCTHIHEDHLSGLAALPDDLLPKTLVQSIPAEFCQKTMHPITLAGKNDSQRKFIRALNDEYQLLQRMDQLGASVKTLECGMSVQLSPELRVEVLGPSAEKRTALEKGLKDIFEAPSEAAFYDRLDDLDSRMNQFSLILRLDAAKIRVLLPGDTDCHGYQQIPPEKLRAQIFKIGHHGQKDGADLELMQAVNPEIMVCCASSDRRYGSANPDLIQLAMKLGINCFFSDCPDLPHGVVSPRPHHALQFELQEGKEIQAYYL